MPRAAPASITPSTEEQIVVTAERLFALYGIAGVSLRQISAESGTANNSAVQYHFGTKDRLLEAILLYRLPGILERRRLLNARVPKRDLRALLEAHLLPMLEMAEGDGYYMSFLEQLHWFRPSNDKNHPFRRLPPGYQSGQVAFHQQVRALISDLPEPLAASRIEQAILICTHRCAERERARHYGLPTWPFGLTVSDLLDGLVGFLEAPASGQSKAALEELL